MSNYDDPRWYEQDNSSDQSSPPDPTDRFPQRIHNDNDALNTSYRGVNDAQSPLSQKFPTRQFSSDSSRNPGEGWGGLGTGTGRGGGRPNSRAGQAIVTIALVIIAFTGGWFGHQLYSGALSSSSNQSGYCSSRHGPSSIKTMLIVKPSTTRKCLTRPFALCWPFSMIRATLTS